MNIFAVDPHPAVCARWLDDKRLVKMVLETAQLLSTAHTQVRGFNLGYKPCHVNHPCTVWARTSYGNFKWLTALGDKLLLEYEYRYDRQHASRRVIIEAYLAQERLLDFLPEAQTPFVNCARNTKLGLDFTDLPVHDAYRRYLKTKWLFFDKKPTWTRRGPPNGR